MTGASDRMISGQSHKSILTHLNYGTFAILTVLLLGISLLVSATVFCYPLEIETRESAVWLHVLAYQAGINIYDHSQVAFVNMYAGPFDPLFKYYIATVLPFLESWQVTRFAVFLLPYLFLGISWRLMGRSSRSSLLQILYMGSIGYLLLVLSAKEFLLVGRFDATASLFFLLLMYVSIAGSCKQQNSILLHGCVCGGLGMAVTLTSWRVMPAVMAVALFTLWRLKTIHQATKRQLFLYGFAYVITFVIIGCIVIAHQFNWNLALYYKHFFGFFSSASGWGASEYGRGSILSFLLSLFNPYAAPDHLKGGPLLLVLLMYIFSFKGSINISGDWIVLAGFVFLSNAAAYYLNYNGGGSWYFIPFMIVIWFIWMESAAQLNTKRLATFGLLVLVLLIVNYRTVLVPTSTRLIRMQEASQFLTQARALQSDYTVLSEDTFLFRTSYQGDVIDSGDEVSAVHATGYYGPAFSRTVNRYFDRLQSHPPDYIVTGFTESPELQELIAQRYQLIDSGPGNLTGNGEASSKLFQRIQVPQVRR